MRIAFLGTGEFAVPALRALRQSGCEVALAVSQPDRPAGRGRRTQPTHVRSAADELDIPHLQAADVNAAENVSRLADVELGVVVAFGQKIAADLLDAPRHGMINLHGSLLPRYRGAAPYQWAMLNGDEVTGVTVFRLNPQWDAGPILGTRETPIDDMETAAELHDRLAVLGAALLVDVVRDIGTGSASAQVQDVSLATRAPKLSRNDSPLDFNQPVERVQRRIHGLWSWPTATADLVGPGRDPLRLQLARAARRDTTTTPTDEFPPGAIRPDGSVQTGRGGLLEPREVKPAGGRLMSFTDFCNGHDVSPPARLATPS